MKQRGKLYGIGVGPGDPELMTIKAVRIINQSDVIVVPGKPGGGFRRLSHRGWYLRESHGETADSGRNADGEDNAVLEAGHRQQQAEQIEAAVGRMG